MKPHEFVIIGIALSFGLLADTTAVHPSTQIKACPALSTADQVLLTSKASAVGSHQVCVQLDPAGFVLDKTTTPWTLKSQGSPVFIDNEPPAGPLDGINAIFTLSSAPNPPSSLHVARNGLAQAPGVDYTLTGSNITFLAGAIPESGANLLASYRR